MKALFFLALFTSLLFCNEEKTLLIVLGMHRSGSSLMAKTLESLGAELGDQLLPPQPDNPKGFFEDVDIGMVNETMLYLHGLAAHSIKPYSNKTQNKEKLIEYGVELLLQKLEGKKIFCFKDPRTARNFSIWREVIDRLPNVAIHVVLIVRNPLSVAKSLEVRNGIDPMRAYYMWLLHYVPVICLSKELPMHIVHYEDLIANPECALEEISKIEGLQLPEDYDFIDPVLEHHVHSLEELKQSESAPEQVVTLYAALEKEDRASSELYNCAFKIQKFISQITNLLELADREMHIGENRESRGFPLIEELLTK